MNCCICGPVKNCGLFLDKVFENIEKIGNLFNEYDIVLYYDHSTDNTLSKIKEYQKKNPRLFFYVNIVPVSKFRTHRIAHARNYCLNYIKQNNEKYNFFIMMDFDDPNCKYCDTEILKKYLTRTDWDGLSFNTSPKYYDIWALSIYPFCFSYNHFNNNNLYYKIIQKYITKRLSQVPKGGLLQCISSFNGFSIYRTDKFLNTEYDGRVCTRLFSKQQLAAHSAATKSPIIFKNYGNVNGRYEDCEHRAFHMKAILNNGARIMISPEVVFR